MKTIKITLIALSLSNFAFSQQIKIEAVSTAGDLNTIKGTHVAAPPIFIATPSSIYGQSSTGIGVIGVSNNQNGIYGLSSGSLGGTVGVNTSTGNGIWGVATGAGKAGLFDGGTDGYGVIVTNGASGFGTLTPTSRLSVIQPSTPVAKVDTFSAIYAFSNTSRASLKGAIFGNYNVSNYGVAIQGIGYQGVNNENIKSSFKVGNQDLGLYGSANTAGVLGTSVDGIGVAGYNSASLYAAVTGGGHIYGVFGYAADNVSTLASTPNTRYGVYGFASGATTNYAGYFSGNVHVSGTLSKGSGTFKIDHPLDPENKYLSHSFVESPDMMNVYNGNITTDSNGYATVILPTYFDALNKDFRYQLTTIGSFAQSMIAEEIKDNKFLVRTSEGNVKLSWQVTGIRKDAFAEAHRVVVEQDKEPELKGYFLHAEELNQPKSRAISEKTSMPKSLGILDNKEEKRKINLEPDTLVKTSNGLAGVEIIENKKE